MMGMMMMILMMILDDEDDEDDEDEDEEGEDEDENEDEDDDPLPAGNLPSGVARGSNLGLPWGGSAIDGWRRFCGTTSCAWKQGGMG